MPDGPGVGDGSPREERRTRITVIPPDQAAARREKLAAIRPILDPQSTEADANALAAIREKLAAIDPDETTKQEPRIRIVASRSPQGPDSVDSLPPQPRIKIGRSSSAQEPGNTDVPSQQRRVRVVTEQAHSEGTDTPRTHDEYMRTRHEVLEKEFSEIQEELSTQDERPRGPILEHHRKQKYVGTEKDGRRIYSCTVASTINALDALGLDPHETDDSVIAALGGVDAFDEDSGFLELGQTLRYLTAEKGLKASLNVNLKSLILTLDTGGVALLAYGDHARLVSGYQVTNGEVNLKINDPFRETVDTIPLERVVNEIVATNENFNVALVTKPKESVPGRVRLR